MQNRIEKRQYDWPLMALFFALQVGNFVGYVSQAYEAEGIFSLVSKGYILLYFAAFLLCILKHPGAMNRSRLVLLLIAMAAVVTASYITNRSVGIVQFVVLLLGYLALPAYLILTPYLPFKKSMINMMKIFNLLTALFFIYCFFVRPEYTPKTDALTFGYSNQNRLAIYLIQNMSILLSLAKNEKKKLIKILIVLICLFETYFVYFTYARIAYICAIMLWLYFLRGNRTTIKKRTIIFVLLLPALFLITVTAIYNSGIIPHDATLWGKPLFSGREEMFASVLKYMKLPAWIIGDFGQHQFTNSHNAFLSILCTTGLIGLVLFILFFFFALMDLRKYSEKNCYHIMPLVGLLLLFIEGCAEAATLVSGAMYASAAAQLVYLVYYGNWAFEEEQK